MPRPFTEATKRVLDQENGGRPPVQVWSRGAMAVAMHPAAAQIAVDVMREGGNAFDAAIALSAAVAVLCPDWAGVAGDAAWLLRVARTGEFLHLDGYSTCPAAMDPRQLAEAFGLDETRAPRAFREEPPNERAVGVVTSMVPGTPATWATLASRVGTWSLADLLAPAIRLAHDGFTVNRYLAQSFALVRSKLEVHASSTEVFARNGRLPREGEILAQPYLASTLSELARTNVRSFYQGAIAERIGAFAKGRAAAIGAEDLAGYRAAWRRTPSGTYRGATIITTGPPTAGVHLLQALAILEGFDLASLGYHSPAGLHCMIEGVKQALQERRLFGADGTDELLNDRLLDGERIRTLRSAIDQTRANVVDETENLGASTTHFVVRDADGNLVSATQSIGSRFGCGEVVSGTGLLMNDRSWWMALSSGPNVVAPRRRANIGHAPAIICRDREPIAALGSPGGFGILQYLVQTIVNMLDHGLDVQDAIDAPRFRLEGIGRRVWVERRIAAATCNALRKLGHEVIDYPEWTDRMGGVEGLEIEPDTGVVLGGYDPRRNSLALGLG